jgi:hypothetical protein
LPALFAYLVALTLLLGGGYGALTWLAAPEPVKVVAKVKPKTVRHYETIPPIIGRSDTPTASSATNEPESGESNETASGDARSQDVVSVTNDRQPAPRPTNDQPRDARAEVSEQASEQPNKQPDKQANKPASEDRPAAVAKPVQDSKSRAARAEAPAAERKREVSVGAEPSRPSRQQTSRRPQTVAAADAAEDRKTADRPRPSQASRRSERSAHAETRGLVRMTLRTIEFPDGSRATRLIPYRGAARDLDD